MREGFLELSKDTQGKEVGDFVAEGTAHAKAQRYLCCYSQGIGKKYEF